VGEGFGCRVWQAGNLKLRRNLMEVVIGVILLVFVVCPILAGREYDITYREYIGMLLHK